MKQYLAAILLFVCLNNFQIQAQTTTYLWSNGATTPTINVSPSVTTTYRVTVTHGGVQYYDSVIVIANANPTQPTVTTTSASCASSGTATITNYEATNTYTFSPAGPSVGAGGSISGLIAGTSYTVIATNANSCSSPASTSFSVSAQLPSNTASAASASPTICSNNALTNITHNTTGATGIGIAAGLPAGVSASWSNNIITISGTPTVAGTYNYSIPLTGGCGTVNAIGSITVTSPITPTFTQVAPICSGATLAALPTTSNNGVSGTWSPALNNTATATTTYTFTPTAGQCASTATMTIVVNPSPTISVNSETICAGNSATLVATPSQIGGTYVWSTGATTSSITVSPTSTATYTVTYSLGTCSDVSATATVLVNEIPEVWVENQVICSGQSVLLNAVSAYKIGFGSYLWSTGETTRLITVSPSSTTNYTVQLTLNGCTSLPVTATVVVLDSPTATIGTTTICSGETVVTANVIPSSDYNYTWTYPATATDPGNVASFSTTEAGTYSVEATPTGIVFAGISPSSIAGTYNFTWAKPINSWSTPDFTVIGTYTQGTLMLVEDGTSGTNAQGHPISQEGCNPLINDLSGKIAVIYRNTCSFATKALNAQNAGANGVIIINRDTTTLEIGGGNGGLNVSIPVIMINSTDGATLVNAMANGPVQVFLGNHLGNQENQNPVSCSNATATETISVSPAASSTTDLTICESELPYSWNGLTFNAAGSQTATLYTASGCDSLATLNLTVSPVSMGTDNITSCTSITWIDGNTYTSSNSTATFTIVGGSASGCDSLVTLNLTISPSVTPTFSQPSPICSGATLSALPTTSDNGITGTWSPALNNTATTTYTFTPTEGQCATTATMTITVNPTVTPTFTQISSICSGATLSALPTTSNNGITGTWSPALSNTATTTYTFTPTSGQCSSTATMTITVNPSVSPTFNQVGPYTSGASIPALPTTSTNGISGTWSPAINNTATTTYTFTPSAGQCGTTTTMTITINQPLQYTLTANDSTVCAGTTVTLSVNIQPSYPAGTVHCNGTPTAVVDVTNPVTGKTWMDRNLGASRAATSSTDAQAYGDLYQWGRGADGHQCRNSATTTTLSSTDQPGHGDFIKTTATPYDWRSPQNLNLWQGTNGVNNPCPSGYRIPTETEINAERLSWSSNTRVGAYASPLKLPVAGARYRDNGSVAQVGTGSHYWSSSVSGTDSRYLYFISSSASIGNASRAYGYSVRCIKD